MGPELTFGFLLVCFLGGPIVNKIGVKWALVLGLCPFLFKGLHTIAIANLGTNG